MTASLEVELTDVSFSFAGEEEDVKVLDDLSLAVPEGTLVSVIGPGGCGKSTIAKLVTGLVQPDAGTVKVGGDVVDGPRSSVGVASKSPALLEWRSLVQNVALPLEVLAPDMPKEEQEERAADLLRMVDLEGSEEKRPSEIPADARTRVALCRALVHYPQLLVLDETFGGSDTFAREGLWQTMNLLREMEPFTCLLFTQNLREAVFLSDEVVILSGRPAKSRFVAKVVSESERNLNFLYEYETNKLLGKIRRQIDAAVFGIELEDEEEAK